MKATVLTFFLLSTVYVFAEEFDELLGEFDEEIKVDVKTQAVLEKQKSWFDFSGDYTFSTAYNYQDRAAIEGISRLRNTLQLEFDMELSTSWKAKIEMKTLYDPIYEIVNRVEYTKTLQSETELKEAFVQGTMGKIDLKIGRQITVWGKSDNIRIADVINPLDNREAGMVDIENLRLPVMTSKLSYFSGDWGFNFLAIHETRVQKEAGIGSEFFPTFMFPAGFTVSGIIDPPSNEDNMQYAASIDGTFSGWDLSFYSAKVLDQKWYLSSGERLYKAIKMNGIALNMASGSWILKTEAAFLEGIRYNTTTKEKSRLDSLVGFEYKGVSDLTLSLEVANRHIYEYETQMIAVADFLRKDEMQTAARASYSFDHENATVNYLASIFGQKFQDGGFSRFWMEYKLSDTVNISAGVIDYIGGEKPYFSAITYNDRIFFDYKYSF